MTMKHISNTVKGRAFTGARIETGNKPYRVKIIDAAPSQARGLKHDQRPKIHGRRCRAAPSQARGLKLDCMT